MPPSSGARLATWELRNAVSSSPITTNFRHLLPVNKRLVKGRGEARPPIKTAPAKDRIKWWNIVPGDQVKVMAEREGVVREVLGVNKISNRVFLQSDKKDGSDSNPRKRSNPAKNVHYSGLQLFLGNYEFPVEGKSGKTQNLPVFAKRLATSEPRWEKHKWVWERFATATVPKLPTWKPGTQERIPIPWPKTEKPAPADPTPYDTPSNIVAQVTYVPPQIPTSPTATLLHPSAPDDYVSMLRDSSLYDPSIPFEVLPARELSNPHSRAKKRARYLSTLSRRRALLSQLVAEELANLGGRTRAAARQDAVFKWRERLKAERKAELKRRWEVRGQKARLERKRERQKKKLERETRRLSELVLREAPNQIVPKAQTASL